MKLVIPLVLLVGLSGCASQQPQVHQRAGYRTQGQLQQTANDARSVEGIVGSATRIGRMLGGGYR